jgi:hypothetical protein
VTTWPNRSVQGLMTIRRCLVDAITVHKVLVLGEEVPHTTPEKCQEAVEKGWLDLGGFKKGEAKALRDENEDVRSVSFKGRTWHVMGGQTVLDICSERASNVGSKTYNRVNRLPVFESKPKAKAPKAAAAAPQVVDSATGEAKSPRTLVQQFTVVKLAVEAGLMSKAEGKRRTAELLDQQ